MCWFYNRVADSRSSTSRTSRTSPVKASFPGSRDAAAARTLARISSLDLRARLIVEGLMTGMHRSPYQGASVEFAQHRPYAFGDDIRHVDWKVLAKTDRVYLKQYIEETNLHLICVVDSSESMGFGTVGSEIADSKSPLWTKFDHATAIAA